MVGWTIVRRNQYDKHSAMRWHLFRYRISVNYYRLKWLKQYEHFRYAILLRNADDIPWMGIVVRLDWSGTNCCFFFIFDGISIGYVEIISRRAVGVILNDRAGVFGRFRAGVLGNVFLSAIKMFWNWKIHDSIQNDSKFYFDGNLPKNAFLWKVTLFGAYTAI